MILTNIAYVTEEAFARSYIPDATLETHRSRANSYGPDEDTSIRMSSSLLHLLLPDGAWKCDGLHLMPMDVSPGQYLPVWWQSNEEL